MPVTPAGQSPGLATRRLASSDVTTRSSEPTIHDDADAVGAMTLHFSPQGLAAQDFGSGPPSPMAVADADTRFRSLASYVNSSPPLHTNPAAPITVEERMAVCSNEAEYDSLNTPDGVSILDALVRGARNSGSSPAPGAGVDEIMLYTSQGLDLRIEEMARLLGAIMDFPEEAPMAGAVAITQPAGAAAQASCDGSVVATPSQTYLTMPTALVKLVLQFLKQADLAMLTAVSHELHKLTPTDPRAGAVVSQARASLAPHARAMRGLVALELRARDLQAKLDQSADGEGTGKGKGKVGSKMLQLLGKGFQPLKGASERRTIANELNRLQDEIRAQRDGLRLDDIDAGETGSAAPWKEFIDVVFRHGTGNRELANNLKECREFLRIFRSNHPDHGEPVPANLSKEKVLDLLKRLNIDSSAIEEGFDSNSASTVHAELTEVRYEIFRRSLSSFAGVSQPEETKHS